VLYHLKLYKLKVTKDTPAYYRKVGNAEKFHAEKRHLGNSHFGGVCSSGGFSTFLRVKLR
jgi:hypothetical protein